MEWTEEIPTEPGYYWFHGYISAEEKRMDLDGFREPLGHKLHVVFVHRISNGFAFICDGHFMFPQEEGAEGIWQFLPIPLLPDGSEPRV